MFFCLFLILILMEQLNFEKPNFISADINILNYTTNYNSTINSFNYIMNDDYENLKKYVNQHIIDINMVHQTPLMLACYLDKIECVKILLCEVGQVDLYDKSALNYCKSDAIKELIQEYETITN